MTMETAVATEHRLTMIEALLASVSSAMTETKDLIKVQNGRVAAHMEADAKWMGEHSENHASEAGYRKALLAIAGAALVLAGALIPVAIQAAFG